MEHFSTVSRPTSSFWVIHIISLFLKVHSSISIKTFADPDTDWNGKCGSMGLTSDLGELFGSQFGQKTRSANKMHFYNIENPTNLTAKLAARHYFITGMV